MLRKSKKTFTKKGEYMEKFKEFVEHIPQIEHQERMQEVLNWVTETFPTLQSEFKWNQPMFTDHGTFIIGFSVTKNHLNIAPERAGMIHFDELIQSKDVGYTKMLVQMKWTKPVDFELLEELIKFNMIDKEHTTSFWR